MVINVTHLTQLWLMTCIREEEDLTLLIASELFVFWSFLLPCFKPEFVICTTLQQQLRTNKEAFPTVPLKSGLTYRFRSDSPLHLTALSAT